MTESARWFDELDNEDQLLRAAEARRRSAAVARTTANRRTAELVSEHRRMYPWLTPGAALSMAKAGITPDSTTAQELAKRAAQRKAKRGFGWHSIGDAVGKVSDAASTFGEYVGLDAVRDVAGEAVERGVKPAARVAFTALESGYQEVQGVVRGAAHSVMQAGSAIDPTAIQQRSATGGYQRDIAAATGNTAPQVAPVPEITGEGFAAGAQSTGAIALGQLVSGEDVDLGEGFFPGGDVAREQKRNANAALSIGGHSGTVGRITAYAVAEPGTTAYKWTSGLIDAAAILALDPADKGLTAVGNLRRARRTFADLDDAGVVRRMGEAAGLLNATRKTTLAERTDQWLSGKDGRKVIDFLVETGDTYDIWRAMGRRIDPADAAKLADSTTEAEVRAILRPKLGLEMRNVPYLSNALTRPFKPVEGYTANLPESIRKRLDGVRLLQTMPGSHLDIEDNQQAVTNIERFMRNAKVDDTVVRRHVDQYARAESRPAKFKAVTEAMNDVLVEVEQFDPKNAKRLTRLFSDSYSDLTKYFVDELGNDVAVMGAQVGPNGMPLPSPHLLNEMINRSIPLPDAREIRRVTSRYGRLLNRTTVEGMDRPVPVAVLDFLAQDIWKPLVLLRGAWTIRVVGEEQVRMAASGLDSVVNHPLSAMLWATNRRGTTDVLGDTWDATDDLSEFARSQSRRGGGQAERSIHRGHRIIQRNEDEYAKALADEIRMLADDPVAKRVGGGWSDGDRVPGDLTGNDVEDAKRWFWDGPGKKFRLELGEGPNRGTILTDRQVADDYIESIARRIKVKTGDQQSLRDVIRTGGYAGESVRASAPEGFVEHIRALAEQGLTPAATKGEVTFATRRTAGSDVGAGLNKAVDHMFNFLMSRPTNRLSRSPAFRQNYWKRIGELLPEMDDAARADAIRQARDAGLSRTALRRLARRVVDRPPGDLPLDDADLLAKGFALDETKALLYDLTERKQFFDIARHIFPFGEAWLEVLGRWAQIGMDRPQTARKAQILIEGAKGSGFYHTDEQTGEEMYTLPGSEFVTEAFTGVPAPFDAPVKGLNIFSNNPLLPGFGPVVQYAIGGLIPDKPQWDAVRDVITPFGLVDVEETGIIESFLPAYVQKFRQAWGDPSDQRMFDSTFADVARWMRSTGDYDMSSREGLLKLERDGKQSAKRMYILRGLAQFFAPSPPSPRFRGMDKDGRVHTAFRLVEEFRKMQDDPKIGYDNAVAAFLDRFGPDAMLFMQSKSEGGGPTTKAALDWVRENPELAEKYPQSYAFFAPQGGDFDYTAYQRLIRSGEIRPLSPREFLELGNHRVASLIYKQAQATVGAKPSDKQRAWLRSLKDGLIDKFPGYDPYPKDMGRVPRGIAELQKAVADPKLSSTPLGESVAEYLSARERAIAAAQKAGVSDHTKAKSMRKWRDWLRAGAAKLSERDPAFAEVWDRLLERELAEDDE